MRAMDAEDLEPRKKPTQKRDLDPMSVEELEEYIVDMQDEIQRVRDNITAKKQHREGIEGIFKK